MTETNAEFIQRIKEKVNPKPGRIYESVMMEIPDMNRLIEQAELLQQPTATADYDYDLVVNENGHIPILIKIHGIEHMVYINEVDAFKLHKKFRKHRLEKEKS